MTKRTKGKNIEGINFGYTNFISPEDGLQISEEERAELADEAMRAATFNKKKAPKVPRKATNFTRGHKFSPGKPMGAKRKTTLAIEQMGEENAMLAMEKIVGWMKEGNMEATKFLLERVYPIRRGRRIKLWDTGDQKTLEDVNRLSEYIMHLMIEGELSAEEAVEYGKKLEQRLRIIMESQKIGEITAKYEALKAVVMDSVRV